MTAPELVAVHAYALDELPADVRTRVLDRERSAAWEGYLPDVIGERLVDFFRDRLDGVEDVRVTSWSLHYHAGAVVEGDVVDPRALARSLGVPEDDRPLRLDPYHAVGVWPGTTGVLAVDDEGGETSPHEAASAALADLIHDALREAEAYADEVTSDAAIAAELDYYETRFDRLGRDLDPVIVLGAEVTP